MVKTFMYFTILTFAVVVVWIGLTIYWNFKPTAPTTEVKVVPIVGSFDFETISRLKSRIPITANLALQFVSTPSAATPAVNEIESTGAASLNTVPTLEPTLPIATTSAQ